MSSRRPHHKSRLGCADCRRRRVKCDEGRPYCNNCQRRGIRCSFHIFDPIPQPGSSTPLSARSNVSHLIHVFATNPPEEDITHDSIRTLLQDETQNELLKSLPAVDRVQLKLVLNHVAAETIRTLTPGNAGQKAWREAIPALASQHQFVLHGFLAMGCLHLSRLAKTITEKDSYHDMAATQMNTGMAQYRKEIETVSTENSEALFAFSASITVFVLFTANTECSDTLAAIKKTSSPTQHRDELISTLLHSVCRLFRSARGVLVILVPCWTHISSGVMKPIVERDWPTTGPETAEEVEHDRKLQKLELMWSQPGKAYEYSFDTLRAALKSLRECSALVSRLSRHASPGETTSDRTFDWSSVIHWTISLSPDFIALLQQRRMEAWVLTAHFAMLPARVKDVVWLEGTGVNILSTAALIISEKQWDWIAWPAAVVGVDLNTLRTPLPENHIS